MNTPFPHHSSTHGELFTDRADELARLHSAITSPGARLLLHGPRRMGKTALLHRALARAHDQGAAAFIADLSTASSPVDLANRVMESATRALRRRWTDTASEFVRRLKAVLSFSPDITTGLIIPSFELSLRSDTPDAQRDTLLKVLDAIEAMAREHDTPIAIILDESQELHQLGGKPLMAQLRASMEHHTHVSYILSTSDSAFVQQLAEPAHPLFGLLDHLALGPIESTHFARWIDERLSALGVISHGVGSESIELVGPRTRDVIALARKVWELTHDKQSADPGDAHLALTELVIEQDDLLLALWEQCTPHQQNVLRAVAADESGLTTGDSIRRFALRSSGTATNSAKALIATGRLVRGPTRTGYDFENPYFREWVRITTLPDLGLHRQPTPSSPSTPSAT